MITAPRFVRINNRLHLCVVGLKEGSIENLAVIQCVGDENGSKETLIENLVSLINRANHEAPIIEYEELPASVRGRLEAIALIDSDE